MVISYAGHVSLWGGGRQLEWPSHGVLSPLGTQVLRAVCQDGALPHSLGRAGFLVLEHSPDLGVPCLQGLLRGVQATQSPSAQLSDSV